MKLQGLQDQKSDLQQVLMQNFDYAFYSCKLWYLIINFNFEIFNINHICSEYFYFSDCYEIKY